MTSKESRYIQKGNHVATLNSEKDLSMPTYGNQFTQHLENLHWLENPEEFAGSSSSNIQQTENSIITQVFLVPLDEEKYLIQFGEDTQRKLYLHIMEKTSADLELTFVKDKGLYMTVSGNPETVRKAQKEIFAWCEEQDLMTIPIPREGHGFIIGKTRDKQQDLEQKASVNTQLLCPHNQINWLDSVGTKQVMHKSIHGFFPKSAKQDKCAAQRLGVEKAFHPLAAGPYSKTTGNILQDMDTRIYFSPSHADQTELGSNERKPQVDQAKFSVNEMLENTKKKTTSVDVAMKLQHDCVIGPNSNSLQEIQERTEVSIELPPSESISGFMTHQDQPRSSGETFTEAYWKARGYIVSTISAPSWLHRHIIGKRGQNISKITENIPKVHIQFTDNDKIILKGPTKDVNNAQEQIEVIVKDLISKMDYAEIHVDYKFHKYLIGKNGAIINRIKEKNKVSVLILPESEKNNLIRIEGEHWDVKQAKRELLELVALLEQEHIKDLVIEQRFHRLIIGQKGERICDIRKKFPDVMINFPDPSEKSDIVQLRGPKHELEKCTEYFENVVANIVENNYSITIPVCKNLHKTIIGKGGLNIKRICSVSNTKINFPSVSSNSENIVIIGKPENCEVARKCILSIQKDKANISEEEISIPSNLHKSLIDSQDCLIDSIVKECGKIHIRFPRNNRNLHKVIIRGHTESVAKAKKKLLQLAEEKQAKSYTISVHVKSQYHQFLMSKNGGNIPKVCKATGVNIIFPTVKDEDQELVTIIGQEEAVKDMQKKLEALIKDLSNMVEDNMLINAKYHHHFLMRRGQVLREMTEEYGGVIVSFSGSGKDKRKVTIKGAKPCVEATKKRIQEIIEDLGSYVTIQCVIPQKFHHFVMGPMCCRIRQIARDYNVQIKFPDKDKPAVQENGEEEGEKSTQELASISPKKSDTIFISGGKEKCKAAKEALEHLIPVTTEVHVPFDLHRYIVGQKGLGIYKITDECEVDIQVSERGQKSDIISIMGLAANVEQAKAKLQERVKALQTEIEDRALRNFKLIFTLDSKYHSKIIGHKGQTIAQICSECDVTIHFPTKDSNEVQNQVIITGYKKNTLAAQNAIMKMVHKIDKIVTKQIPLNPLVRGRVIGFRGKAIHKIMSQYHVDIHVPPKGSSNPSVTVTGLPDKVKTVIDHINSLEKHYLSIVMKNESEEEHIDSVSLCNTPKPLLKNFAKKDVPCISKTTQKPPDVYNSEDFPTLKHRMSPETHPWRK